MDAPGLRSVAARVAAAFALLLAAAAPASAASDPLIGQQWVVKASDPFGVRGAWTSSSGRGVVVAVIDSGLQIDHPDLQDNVWTNPDEVANGADDDGNGFVDDLHGANVLAGSGDVDDDRGHGTNIAGIIAARSGNGLGGAGLAPEAQIMPVKVFSSVYVPTMYSVARAIRYAVGEGARIISISLNGASTPELIDAARFAEEHGATIVASAGNHGENIDTNPSFPASLPDAAVLGVTATTEMGTILDGSSYGPQAVDLAAPGDMMLTTARGSGYGLAAGTSMATPVVAAALALLSAARPELSQPELREVLLATSDRTPGVAGRVGAGVIDIGAAMRRLVPTTQAATSAAAPGLRLRAPRRPRAGRVATVRWSATNASSITRWRVSLDGRHVRTLERGRALRAHSRISRVGRHRWTVRGYDAANRRVVSSVRSFTAVGA